MSRSRYHRRRGVRALWISVTTLGCHTTVPPPVSHSAPPLTVETTLSAKRVEPGRIITINDVGIEGEVVNGDRLQLMIKTSQDAYLYLVYCSQHDGDSGFEGMSLFPHEGGQRLAANAMTTVPPTGAIVVDDKPGRETLYVIVSRDELSRADARLADNLKNAQQRSPAGDCTTKLQSQPPRPPMPNTPPRLPKVPSPPAEPGGQSQPPRPPMPNTPPRLPKVPSPPAEPGGRSQPPRSPMPNTPPRLPKVPSPPAEPGGRRARADDAVPPPGYSGRDLGRAVVNTQRGIDVVLDDDQTGLPRRGVVADVSGIVVVRFDLQHVSPR